MEYLSPFWFLSITSLTLDLIKSEQPTWSTSLEKKYIVEVLLPYNPVCW